MPPPSFDHLTTPIGNRRILVEASAGTGKTFALTGLVVRLVMEGVELKKILVVTFTNAATDELKTRIRSRLREVLSGLRNPALSCSADAAAFRDHFAVEPDAAARIEQALLEVDEASVFTIHGFCQRVLQQSAFESGAPFEPEFTDESEELLDRAVADFWSRHTHDDPWLGALASMADTSTFRSHFKDATRYPDTIIQPEAVPLDKAVALLRKNGERLSNLWKDRKEEVVRLLGNTTWTAKGVFRDAQVLGYAIDQLDHKLATQPHSCSNWIHHLSVGEILNYAGKRSNAQKAHRELLEAEAFFQVCEEFSDAHAAARLSLIRTFIEEVGQRFTHLKQSAGVLTYDDLLERVDEALADDSDIRERLLASIRSRWTHALVDEFQDTDPRQYRIFRTAFDGRPLVFVGDPKQAIYSFRGADLHAYIDAKRDTEDQPDGPHRYMLGRNWRSASKLVEAVNALFAQAGSHPFVLDDVPYEPVEPAGSADDRPLEGDGLPPMVWWIFKPLPEDQQTSRKKQWNKEEAVEEVIPGVVNGIKELLSSDATIDGSEVEPSNIAILVSTNKEGETLQKALGEAGIPAVTSKGGSVWLSEEAAAVEHLLRAFLRPSDRTSICTALATDLWGYTADKVREVRQDEELMETIRGRLASYRQTWRRQGVMRGMMQFIEDERATERLLSFRGGERRLTNVRHILELLHEEESRHNRGPDELVQWLRTRESRTTDDSDATELRLETDAEAVQIVTIHKSKGLQYDIVIAPFLWSAKSRHDKSDCVLVHEDDGEIVYDIGWGVADGGGRFADAGRWWGDVGLAYGGLRRAVDGGSVLWRTVTRREVSAPAYLLADRSGKDDEGSIADRALEGFKNGKDGAALLDRKSVV